MAAQARGRAPLAGRAAALTRQVIGKMADRLVHLVQLVEDLSLRPVTCRLARMLLEEADGDVLRRRRWHTQAELAAELGTVQAVFQRALSALAA